LSRDTHVEILLQTGRIMVTMQARIISGNIVPARIASGRSGQMATPVAKAHFDQHHAQT